MGCDKQAPWPNRPAAQAHSATDARGNGRDGFTTQPPSPKNEPLCRGAGLGGRFTSNSGVCHLSEHAQSIAHECGGHFGSERIQTFVHLRAFGTSRLLCLAWRRRPPPLHLRTGLSGLRSFRRRGGRGVLGGNSGLPQFLENAEVADAAIVAAWPLAERFSQGGLREQLRSRTQAVEEPEGTPDVADSNVVSVGRLVDEVAAKLVPVHRRLSIHFVPRIAFDPDSLQSAHQAEENVDVVVSTDGRLAPDSRC